MHARGWLDELALLRTSLALKRLVAQMAEDSKLDDLADALKRNENVLYPALYDLCRLVVLAWRPVAGR